jgi:predicted RNA binding protein YcfA (HicA-like mRNA interferase family)
LAELRVLSGNDVVEILTRHGFSVVRQKGSHAALRRQEGGGITVIVPLHRELRSGTLQSIIRQSKLDRSLFERDR